MKKLIVLIALFASIGAYGAQSVISNPYPPLLAANPFKFLGSGTAGYDGEIFIVGGSSLPNRGQLTFESATQMFESFDGTPQFAVGLTNGSVEYWNAEGGILHQGSSLYATNGTLAGDVSGNFAAQNLGTFNFGNGSGSQFSVGELGLGTGTTAQFTIYGGEGNNPRLTSNSGADFYAATGQGFNYYVNSVLGATLGVGVVTAINSGTNSALSLKRSDTGATVGGIKFTEPNSSSVNKDFVSIFGNATTTTSGSEAGSLTIQLEQAGAIITPLTLTGTLLTLTVPITAPGTSTFGTNLVQLNSGGVVVGNTSAFGFSSTSVGTGSQDASITRKGAANLRIGQADVAAPIPQIVSVQGVVGGTINAAGVTTTLQGSQSTGTGAGGSIVVQTSPAAVGSASTQNAFVTNLTLAPGLDTLSAHVSGAYGSVPALAGTGCAPTSGITNSDSRGSITTTASTSCTETFATAYTTLPICGAFSDVIGTVPAVSATLGVLTLTSAALTGHISWWCGQ